LLGHGVEALITWLGRVGSRWPAPIPWIVEKRTKLPVMLNTSALAARKDLEGAEVYSGFSWRFVPVLLSLLRYIFQTSSS